jgi:CubicO group peptidase (beta-lactamase class C family)
MRYSIIFIFMCFFLNCSSQTNSNNDEFIKLSSLREVGFNEQIWNNIDKEILQGNYGLMNSVLIIYNDKLILEKYYNDWTRDKLHEIHSVTKSVTSALIGIALDKGYIPSVNQKMSDYFPQNEMDSLKKQITLQNMLTMSAGLNWDERSKRYYEPGNTITDMLYMRDDWIDYILEQPMSDTPGERFNYNGGISILLGSIIHSSSKMTVSSFAEKYLFQPIGINHYQWPDHMGLSYCAGGLSLRSIDLAKFGYLYYSNGKWKGNQVISESWIKESLKPRYKSELKTCYGYQWWSIDSLFNFETIPYAAGYGWQYVYLIKEFNLMVVFTAKNFENDELNATFSPDELLFGILCCSPKFKKRIINIYEKQKTNPTKNIYEAIILTYCLNTLGEYLKTIDFLNRISQNFSNDIWFNYYMGVSYFYTGDTEKSLKYLRKCISAYTDKNSSIAGYYKLANEIIEKISKNGM